ncbi:hypothetical protein [Streptomyces sp. NPDC052042]|uniref:hypothetical protein n=1 Tax=Streptomyces sp. NPDC052042 TaxID=3365683 RepID=UPI0037D2D5D8
MRATILPRTRGDDPAYGSPPARTAPAWTVPRTDRVRTGGTSAPPDRRPAGTTTGRTAGKTGRRRRTIPAIIGAMVRYAFLAASSAVADAPKAAVNALIAAAVVAAAVVAAAFVDGARS